MNPQYKIYGQKRREMKKKLSKAKYYIKCFWSSYYWAEDLCEIYGCQNIMTPKEEAQKKYDQKLTEVRWMEKELKIPYKYTS